MVTPENLCQLVNERKDRFPIDPYNSIQAGTNAHRGAHGCWAYPYADGSRLGTISAVIGAKRIVELGTALGYTALWLAHGSAEAHVDTIDRDPEHVSLARENISGFDLGRRITVHQGDFEKILSTFEPGYDIAFFDGYAPALSYLDEFYRLVRPGGVLISANLSMADTEAYHQGLANDHDWHTAFLSESHDTAISLRADSSGRE